MGEDLEIVESPPIYPSPDEIRPFALLIEPGRESGLAQPSWGSERGEAYVEPGDEPEAMYDLAPPIVSAARPVEALPADAVDAHAAIDLPADSVLSYATPAARVATSADEPAPANLDELWDPWDGSRFRSLDLPVAIMAASVVLTYVAMAMYSPTYHGALHALRYVMLSFPVRVALVLLAAWGLAGRLEIYLGRVVPVLLKLSAIALAPPLCVALVTLVLGGCGLSTLPGLTDLFEGDRLGALAGGFIYAAATAILFFALFEVSRDSETWWFLLLIWFALFLIAGIIVHMVLDPPPFTPVYVPPKNPMKFLFGN